MADFVDSCAMEVLVLQVPQLAMSPGSKCPVYDFDQTIWCMPQKTATPCLSISNSFHMIHKLI